MAFLHEIIAFLDPIDFIGDNSIKISRILPIDSLEEGEDVLMWCSERNNHLLGKINKGTIICSASTIFEKKKTCNYILVDNPRKAFKNVVKKYFHDGKYAINGISNTSIIHPSVIFGLALNIGHYVVIEAGCKIGNHVEIGHHTVLKAGTIIGDEVIIGCHNTIGGNGFGYEKNEAGDYEHIPHLGNVVISNKVEIGNNTCIDRAVLGSTIIEENVKIDNLVHIAHGVKIGRNSLIIANAMIAGSVKIGENAWIAPSTSVLNKLNIGEHSTIGMGAVVIRDVANGQVVVGNPAKPIKRK